MSQTYSNLELVLINDGSKDNSKAVCEKWVKRDKRVTLINKENGGASSARNLGIDNARGKFIQFVDADDFIDREYTSILMEPFYLHKNIDMSIGGFVIEDVNKIETYKPENSKVYNEEEFNDFNTLWKLIHGRFAFLDSPINKIYRKEKMGKFEETICISEDKEFNINYLKNVKNLAVVENTGYHYIMNGESLSHKKYPNLHLDLQRVDDILFDYMDNFVKNENHSLKSEIALETFLRCLRHYFSQGLNKNELLNKTKEMAQNYNLNKFIRYKQSANKYKIVAFLLRKRWNKLLIVFDKKYVKIKNNDIYKI